VKLDGKVDALVFAGGIGERSALFRKEIIQQILSLEFAVNDEKNNSDSTDEDITVMDITKNPTKPPRVLICQTNEQVSLMSWNLATCLVP
jgi:acetate kinase